MTRRYGEGFIIRQVRNSDSICDQDLAAEAWAVTEGDEEIACCIKSSIFILHTAARLLSTKERRTRKELGRLLTNPVGSINPSDASLCTLFRASQSNSTQARQSLSCSPKPHCLPFGAVVMYITRICVGFMFPLPRLPTGRCADSVTGWDYKRRLRRLEHPLLRC